MNGWIIGFSIGMVLGSIIFNMYFYKKLRRERIEMTKKIIQEFHDGLMNLKSGKNVVNK